MCVLCVVCVCVVCVCVCVCVCVSRRYVCTLLLCLWNLSLFSVALCPEDGRVQRWCFDEAQKCTFTVMERQYVCVAVMGVVECS